MVGGTTGRLQLSKTFLVGANSSWSTREINLVQAGSDQPRSRPSSGLHANKTNPSTLSGVTDTQRLYYYLLGSRQ